MASANWDLVQQLAQEFFNVQQQSCSLRLSERNWIEIVNTVLKTHDITVIYTKDGKEMVTPEQLLREIKLCLDRNDGRASFSQMQDELGVDYAVIEERCVELIKQCNNTIAANDFDGTSSWNCWRILDQIVTSDYCNCLRSEIISELETEGRIGVGSLASKYQLPADFVRSLLPSSKNAKYIIDGDYVYSENFIRRATSRLVGLLSAAIRPLKVANFAQQIGLPERLVVSVLDDALSSGRLSGCFQHRMFVPYVFTEAQQECIKSALNAVYVDATALKRLGVIADVEDVVKREWSSSDDEPVRLQTGFIRKSAISRLDATVEEACKAPSDKELKEGAGWLDTNGASIALGVIDSLPQDIAEKLLKQHIRLMEIIDCNTLVSNDLTGKAEISESSDFSDENVESVDSEGDFDAENYGDLGLVAVAPWLIEKCSDNLYHRVAAKISEKRRKALTQQVIQIQAEGFLNQHQTDLNVDPEPVVAPAPSSKKKQGKRKGAAKESVAKEATEPSLPKMYRVSRRQLTRMLIQNRTTMLAPDFPHYAIKPFIYQLVHVRVAKRVAELAAMTPKSTAATATNSKTLQEIGSVNTNLPKLIVTLASCWRAVTQHLLTETGATAERDRRAISVHLRELMAAPIATLSRDIPYPGKESGQGGRSAELLAESVGIFESKFMSNDVEGAIEALISLFEISSVRNGLNSINISANGLCAVLSSALPSAAVASNKIKSNQQKAAVSVGITVEQLRQDHLSSGLLKLKAMASDDQTDPLLLPNVLLLVSSLIFERLTGELISCPGRLVPTLVTYLTTNANLEADTARLLSRSLTASQKSLKPKKKGGASPKHEPSEETAELIQELIANVENPPK